VGRTESAGTIAGRDIPSVPFAAVACCMLAGALYAYAVGDDVNWDWRNYHAYDVWATINHRHDIDVVPAGFQTYFNPLIYYPIYLLRQSMSPLWTGLITGAVHGLNLVAIYSLTRALLGSAANAACLAASCLLAAFGPMTLSEVGTSFADIVLSLPIIAALILITSSDQKRPKFYILAGALIGASVGFKLTNVVFALGLVAAVIAATRPLAAVGGVMLGGAIGGLIAGAGGVSCCGETLGIRYFRCSMGSSPRQSYRPSTSWIGNSSHAAGSMGWLIRSTGLPVTTAAPNMRFATPASRWRLFSLQGQSAPA
jgi:Glycosyltransferase family 87